jgi:DNA-binding NarL/FixJ family response regulator
MNQGVIVLVITDGVLRNGIQSCIVQQANAPSVEVFSTLKAFENAHLSRVDVLFLDESCITSEWLTDTITQLAAAKHPVVLLSRRLHAEYIRRIIQAGARGFIYRDDVLEDSVPMAIRVVRRNVVYISPKATEMMTTGSLLWDTLSPRARNVLKMMAQGMAVKEIARELEVAPKTIYRDRERLREALNVGTNEQIVAEALRQGLL